MSIWAGIKYALNSTLGTSDFKPLDKLIAEQTRIVASDDAYATLTGGGSVVTTPVNTEVSYTLPKKLKMTRAGSLRISGTLSRTNSSKMRGAFIVLVNDVEVGRYSRGTEVGTNSDEFSLDISFEAGNIISFKITGTNTASTTDTRKVSISDLTLCGRVINNVHEVIS